MHRCLTSLQALDQIGGTMKRDSDWLVRRLAGVYEPVPGALADDLTARFNDNIRLVHRSTPEKKDVKAHLIKQLKELPGLAAVSSQKSLPTKLKTFNEAVENGQRGLLQYVDGNTYSRLFVDNGKFGPIMEAKGGTDVFGDWANWGDVFAHREAQSDWDPEGAVGDAYSLFEDVGAAATGQDPAAPRIVDEVVNVNALRKLQETGEDNKLEALNAYLHRFALESKPLSDGHLAIQITYAQRGCYGKYIARGPSVQKLSRGARAAALQSQSALVDAPACHIRLLERRLRRMEIFSEEKYGMIAKAGAHYKNWRSAVAACYNFEDLDDAKMALVKLGYGARPVSDVPFLRAFAAQMSAAATEILGAPDCAWVH